MNKLIILIADDDDDDIFLMKNAFQENGSNCTIHTVNDGDEVMPFLNNNTITCSNSLRFIILLDINMPLKDGWQVLGEIKSSEKFRHIPIIMFSTSSSESQIKKSYDLGANSYITKPSSYTDLKKIAQLIGEYWQVASQ